MPPSGEIRCICAGAGLDACLFDPQRLFGRTNFDHIFICYSLGLLHVAPRDGLERSLSTCARRQGAMLSIQRPFRDYSQYAVLRMAA